MVVGVGEGLYIQCRDVFGALSTPEKVGGQGRDFEEQQKVATSTLVSAPYLRQPLGAPMYSLHDRCLV